MSVRPAKTQISLGIRPVWSEFSLCAQWVAKNPSFLHADSKDWSDWADAQADPSLCWAHMPFCWFCPEAAQMWFLERPKLVMCNNYMHPMSRNKYIVLCSEKETFHIYWCSEKITFKLTRRENWLTVSIVQSKSCNSVNMTLKSRTNQLHVMFLIPYEMERNLVLIRGRAKVQFAFEPGLEKMCLMPYANNKGADQPAHPRSLISAFLARCEDRLITLVYISEISRF